MTQTAPVCLDKIVSSAIFVYYLLINDAERILFVATSNIYAVLVSKAAEPRLD
jgi:hypothetical protein